MSNVRTAVRKHLLNGIAKQAGVEELMQQVEDARAGMYTHGVLAAIAADGDGAVFEEVCDTLADDFRTNRRGIAEKYNCDQQRDKQGKLKTDKDGNPVYKVPSSLSSMRSHLKAAFEFGTDLGTAKKPAAFSAIRTANQVAREEAAKAARTPADEARDALAEIMQEISDAVSEASVEEINVIAELLQAVAAQAKAA